MATVEDWLAQVKQMIQRRGLEEEISSRIGKAVASEKGEQQQQQQQNTQDNDNDNDAGDEEFNAYEMQMIVPGVFISGADIARDKDTLLERNITHVCCCIDRRPPHMGVFKYLVLKVDDSPCADILKYFDNAISFIDTARAANGNVLIHCVAGISRSAAVATAYVMHALQLGVDQALGLVKAARQIANPNPGFIDQLRQFDLELKERRLLY